MGVGVDFDMDKIGLAAVGVFQFGNGVDLGAAGGGDAESGGGKDDDGRLGALDGGGKGKAVQVRVGGVVGGQLGDVGYFRQGFGAAQRRAAAYSRRGRLGYYFQRQSGLGGKVGVGYGDVQTPGAGAVEVQFGTVSPADAVGPGMIDSLDGFSGRRWAVAEVAGGDCRRWGFD